MRLFGLSKASTHDWSRPTGQKDQAWHCLNFSLISPHAWTWKKGIKNKFSIEQKLSGSSYSNLFSLSHNEQLIILWLRVPQYTQGNKLLPIQSISSSHRAQVITSCSTSLRQIVSVTDKATLLFSLERISKVFFLIPCLLWKICLVACGGNGIDLTYYSAILQHFCACPFAFCQFLLSPERGNKGNSGFAKHASALSSRYLIRLFRSSYVCVFQFVCSITLTANWIWGKKTLACFPQASKVAHSGCFDPNV